MAEPRQCEINSFHSVQIVLASYFKTWSYKSYNPHFINHRYIHLKNKVNFWKIFIFSREITRCMYNRKIGVLYKLIAYHQCLDETFQLKWATYKSNLKWTLMKMLQSILHWRITLLHLHLTTSRPLRHPCTAKLPLILPYVEIHCTVDQR